MKIVFASRTGNVQTIVDSLKTTDPLHIQSGTEKVTTDYILFTYTDGYGDVPQEVEMFLESNSSNLKGVIVSGDHGYGDAYCVAGDTIAENFNVECLYKVENDGTPEDIEKIQAIVDAM